MAKELCGGPAGSDDIDPVVESTQRQREREPKRTAPQRFRNATDKLERQDCRVAIPKPPEGTSGSYQIRAVR